MMRDGDVRRGRLANTALDVYVVVSWSHTDWDQTHARSVTPIVVGIVAKF